VKNYSQGKRQKSILHISAVHQEKIVNLQVGQDLGYRRILSHQAISIVYKCQNSLTNTEVFLETCILLISVVIISELQFKGK